MIRALPRSLLVIIRVYPFEFKEESEKNSEEDVPISPAGTGPNRNLKDSLLSNYSEKS
jgi:hypothetical protein